MVQPTGLLYEATTVQSVARKFMVSAFASAWGKLLPVYAPVEYLQQFTSTIKAPGTNSSKGRPHVLGDVPEYRSMTIAIAFAMPVKPSLPPPPPVALYVLGEFCSSQVPQCV